MIDRKEVYATIDTERDYQNKVWGEQYHDEDHSIGDWLTFAQVYLNKAMTAYTGPGNAKEAALHEIRKVAALMVACMECNGAPERIVDE